MGRVGAWLHERMGLLTFTPEQVVAAAVPVDEVQGSPGYGVYFLVRGGKVCYVGQAKCILTRMHQHRGTGRTFDAVAFIEGIHQDAMNDIEAAYRDGWEPPWNRARVSWFSQESRKLMATLEAMDQSLISSEPEFPPFTPDEMARLVEKMDRMFDPPTESPPPA